MKNNHYPSIDGQLIRKDIYLLGVVFVFVVIAAYCAGQFVLQDFPNSADEHAYLYQARLFAEGTASAPAHSKQEFLSPFFILTHENRVFSIFPPGWPFFLSLGVRSGLSDWVNPVMGGLSVWLVFAIGFAVWGRREAWFGTGLFVLSPFFLFNSASYFSHPSCLLGVLLTCWLLMLWEKNEYPVYAVLAGIALSLTFSIREFTAILALAAPLVITWVNSLNRKMLFGCIAAGALPGIFLYLYYNQCITGGWWMPARFLQAGEGLGFGDRTIHVFDYVEIQHYGIRDGLENLWSNLSKLVVWTLPGLPLLAVLGFWNNRKDLWILSLGLSSLLLPLGYILYPSDGGNQYGPRFYYESLGFLVILSAPIVERFIRKTSGKTAVILVCGMILLIDVYSFGYWGNFYYNQVYERRTLYRLVEHRNIENAVVFVAAPSGDMTQGDLIRNPAVPEDARVIYAWYLGDRNQELATQFPDRTYYLYGRDTRTGSVYLERLSL